MFGKAKKAKGSYGIVGLAVSAWRWPSSWLRPARTWWSWTRTRKRSAPCGLHRGRLCGQGAGQKDPGGDGIQNCDVAVVCIGEKMDVSILTTLHLVSMGIPTVIAKAASEEQGQVLRKLGAQVVYPEHDMAIRLAHRLETTGMLDFVQLSEQISISKLAVPAKMIGKTVVDVNLRGQFGLNIIAIENAGKVNESVGPNTVFQEGDILFVSGGKNAVNKMAIGWTSSKPK